MAVSKDVKDWLGRRIWVFLLLIYASSMVYQSVLNTHFRTDIRESLQRHVETRRDVLCPLYGIFLDLYEPNSPEARVDPQLYEARFQTIRNGNAVLRCPPRPS